MSDATEYIHGYSAGEQARLYAQAALLEPMVFDGVGFPAGRVLELGCGVGAQSKTLLRRFPEVKLVSVDLSEHQLARAREHLDLEAKAGRVELEKADARRLPHPGESFDGAFLCWVLEHMPRPLEVLEELRRVLRPGAALHGIEVMNRNLYLFPECFATMRYWDALNAEQRRSGGDPDVGAKMGNLLREAGFGEVRAEPYPMLHDQRDRADLIRYLDYWERLLLSAAPRLLAAKTADEALIGKMKAEFHKLREDNRAVFHYAPVKFSARR